MKRLRRVLFFSRQGGATKLQLELWYRRNAQGQWELDAVYPMTNAALALSNDSLSELSARLAYGAWPTA